MARTDRQQLYYYMSGHGLYFLAMGIQSVLFPWLLTVLLGETADRVGIGQMLFYLPTLLLVLYGGAVADRNDCRALLLRLQFAAALPSLLLIGLTLGGLLNFSALVLFALVTGTLSAFLTPARDSLLTRVSGGDIQRAVNALMMVQFGGQFLGLMLAGSASWIGPLPLLALQVAAMLVAVFTTWRLDPAPPQPRLLKTRQLADVVDGLREVLRSPQIAPVVLYSFATGLLLMGLYLVVLPLLVRDVYRGGSEHLAGLNICFIVGVSVASLGLMRYGQVRRQGRAIMLASFGSAGVVLALHLAPPLPVAYLALFVWGLAAGVSMNMGRSLVQGSAPPSHRARILAAYQLGFVGGAPIGSFVVGYLVAALGLQNAMLVPLAGVAVLWIAALLFSRLWHLEPPPAELPAGGD